MLSESTTEEVREFSEENFGDKKERLLHNTDRSIFVMGDWPHNFLTEGDEERIRNWEEENDIPADKLAFGFERLDFMASPYTFEEGARELAYDIATSFTNEN